MVENPVAIAVEADAPKERTARNYCEPVRLGIAHHWDIEPPNGPISMGMCGNCGTIRAFSNSGVYIPWSEAGNLRNANRDGTGRFSEKPGYRNLGSPGSRMSEDLIHEE